MFGVGGSWETFLDRPVIHTERKTVGSDLDRQEVALSEIIASAAFYNPGSPLA